MTPTPQDELDEFISEFEFKKRQIKRIEDNTRQDTINHLREEIEKLQQSSDCYGCKEHKVLTANTIYNFPIESDNITATMKRLKQFAMDCFQNGWLQATSEVLALLDNYSPQPSRFTGKGDGKAATPSTLPPGETLRGNQSKGDDEK